jgi:Fe-Mn family superoxide dismutase
MESYQQRELKYGFNGLEPVISEEQLKIHFQKHHASYIKKANALWEKLEKARENDEDLDMKSTLKSLEFNIGGHILHSLFWENMMPEKDATGEPFGEIKELIEKDFGSFERFKKEFTDAAKTLEGSGWAILTYDWQAKRLLIQQVEKHNTNLVPSLYVLLVLDMWEHAFYLDYKNEKDKFVENWWKIVCWHEVNERLKGMRFGETV